MRPPAPDHAWQTVDDYAVVMGSMMWTHALTARGNTSSPGCVKRQYLHGERHFECTCKRARATWANRNNRANHQHDQL
eukprot:9080999-Lingulodinium_polyedra.AAC.1